MESKQWSLIDVKQVTALDGFLTDYAWYHLVDRDGSRFVFIFGDCELYDPDNSYPDWIIDISYGYAERSFDEAYEEAREWFENYTGFDDFQ